MGWWDKDALITLHSALTIKLTLACFFCIDIYFNYNCKKLKN